MKRLSNNEEALKAQSILWGLHMNKQFADREVYWSNRTLSRIGKDCAGQKTLTLIVDSMDHAKWAIPQSEALAAKSFNNLVRPHMDCTAILCHGHLVAVAFTEHQVIKGGDYTCELLCHTFDKLTQTGPDLREYEIHLQCDNCSKEGKNNAVVRLLGYLCSKRSIRAARLHSCVSGHSHEDVDQFFSLLGAFLATKKELYNPAAFMESLRQYLSNPAVRQHERIREVLKIDCVRSWILSKRLASRFSRLFSKVMVQLVFETSFFNLL